MRLLAASVLFLPLLLPAQDRPQIRRYDYAILLSEPPVAVKVGRKQLAGPEATAVRTKVAAQQADVRRELSRRGIRVISKADLLVNALFVSASREEAESLKGLDGVREVQLQLPMKLHLNRALDLHRVSQAWASAGGRENAGAGIRIGILDTGIDHTHPAFNDPSLTVPAGYPRGEAAFTNNKIIVARSYVPFLPFAQVDASDSRPDDYSPRDRVGHGTAAAMIAAGVTTTGPVATITGVAPKAYLGNYKIFGSPGVNDTTRTPVVVAALEDAFADGMDVVTMSFGSPSLYPALDTCLDRNNLPTPCDVRALTANRAVTFGMAVVVSAGNDGENALFYPNLNSINTPGTAPLAITVGASTNAHEFYSSVTAQGIAAIRARFGDGPKPDPTLAAPGRDVTSTGDDGFACQPLGNGSLTGVIAIVNRGNCSFFDKVRFSAEAGAVAVIITQTDSDAVFPPTGLTDAPIPAALIGAASGNALRGFVSGNPGANLTLDPRLNEVNSTADRVAPFSSRGPSTGDALRGEGDLKPDLTAVGDSIYTAAQTYDPSGKLYDPSGYSVVSGTSFSVPMVAGAVAMVFQKTPSFDALDVKSAVVNSAATGVRDEFGPAYTLDVGAGKLDVNAALQATTTVAPAVLSFGVILPGQGAFTRNLSLAVYNSLSTAQSYTVSVENRTAGAVAPAPAASSFTLQGGATGSLIIRLVGTPPQPGVYEGSVLIQGPSTTVRVPYAYLVCDNVGDNIAPIAGDFTGAINEGGIFIAAKVVDRFGTPLRNASAQFSVVSGGGRIELADATTDNLGIAAALVQLGPQLGQQVFRVTVAGLSWDFFGLARQTPAIAAVVNGASFQGGAQAAGSYISIFGENLADFSRGASPSCLPGPPICLPVAISSVSVSFDTPGRSFPGHLSFVSPGQVNVQIPWEFDGLTNVQMKVSKGSQDSESSAVFTVPLAPASPAFFEFTDTGSGRTLAAALDTDFQLLTPANPARRGQAIQLYMNGLGAVNGGPASGDAAPGDLILTRAQPTVTIGGRTAAVLFSGLAPGFVGLYQVNAVVPDDVEPGVLPVSLTIAGATTRASNVPVQ